MKFIWLKYYWLRPGRVCPYWLETMRFLSNMVGSDPNVNTIKAVPTSHVVSTLLTLVLVG